MTDSFKIRKIAQADYEDWESLWKSYLDFYNTERSKNIFRLTFSRLIDDDCADCEGYIAHVDGQAAGIVHCLYHLHLWQEEKICYLQDMFVDESFRKQGIARKLIERIYARADEKKAKGVYWTTQDFNMVARRLYDEIGHKTPFIKYVRT